MVAIVLHVVARVLSGVNGHSIGLLVCCYPNQAVCNGVAMIFQLVARVFLAGCYAKSML